MTTPRLPTLAVAATVLVAILGCGGLDTAPPDVANPQTHTAGTLSFRYPGNWQILRDVDRKRQGPWDFRIKADGLCSLYVAERPVAEIPLDMNAKSPLLDTKDVDRWGNFDGKGKSGRTDAMLEMRSRVFVEKDGRFAVGLACLASDLSIQQPGLDLIEQSFAVAEP